MMKPPKPKLLDIFSNKKIKTKKPLLPIIIDYREKNSLVASELKKLGFNIEFKHLSVGDYIINSTAIERKTISDFKSSIKNKRLMQQLLELKQYHSHFLILEGDMSENNNLGLHENAFRGFLLSIINEIRTPIIFSQDAEDTAKYLYVLANKKSDSKHAPIRASKILLNEKEQLQFILEGFPQIGPITSKKLLSHFKTLNNLANASQESLKEIIGKKSEIVYKLLNVKY